MKVLSSIAVFAVAAVGLAVGQFGGPALERQGGVMGKPQMDRQRIEWVFHFGNSTPVKTKRAEQVSCESQ